MTERLYLRDPLIVRFHARVVRSGDWKGAPSLVLDRSAFYPEGGGQPGDRGAITVAGLALSIVDVQVNDDGEVHHIVADAADSLMHDAALEGRDASGVVEPRRRRDQMSQHTGQHMLSRALLDIAKAETISSRLGEESSTIDLGVASLEDRVAVEAEDLVNEIVLEDRPVETLFPTPEELARLALRRTPKVSANVRVISIDGFDLSPCGGTHCTRTGQVGAVRIVGVERYKGLTRVAFLAGRRTLDDYRRKDVMLRDLARSFTCGALDVPAAVSKLRADLKARSDLFAAARGELVQLLSEHLLAQHPPSPGGTTVIAVERTNDDLGALRALAGALARRADVVAIVGSRDRDAGDWLVSAERGEGAVFDAGKWFKGRAAALGGRGGGRPDRAEGRLPGTTTWAEIVGGLVE